MARRERCNGCKLYLMVPPEAQSIRCAVCHTITDTNNTAVARWGHVHVSLIGPRPTRFTCFFISLVTCYVVAVRYVFFFFFLTVSLFLLWKAFMDQGRRHFPTYMVLISDLRNYGLHYRLFRCMGGKEHCFADWITMANLMDLKEASMMSSVWGIFLLRNWGFLLTPFSCLQVLYIYIFSPCNHFKLQV